MIVRVFVILLLASGAAAAAQGLPPGRLTFEEAVQRAVSRNPAIAGAAQTILQAETLLQQAQTVRRPIVSGGVTTSMIDSTRGFDEFVTQPRTQSLLGLSVSYPVLAASQWARQAQAGDQIRVARLGADEVRRQIATATAQAYLSVIAMQRQVEVHERARENAIAHVEFARARLQGGVGSKLNELRASQELATSEMLLESARLALRRAQEALGVLVTADAPVDAAAEPSFEAMPRAEEAAWLSDRADVQFVAGQVDAAARVARDSWRDWVPTATVSFEPQWLTPAGLFTPSRTWRGLVSVAVPIFDGGARRVARRQRELAVETARLQLSDVELRARAERRVAEAAVESGERGLQHARAAAQHAADVLAIADLAFRAGATTNIELIDAQRRARDADTAAAQAEDRVRQARLELLVAIGGFPR